MLSLTVDAGSSCLREHDSPRMRKTMPAICRIALALCFFSAATFGQTAEPAAPRPSKAVVFLGDSLTAGFGVQPNEAFPALIGEKVRAAGFQRVYAELARENNAVLIPFLLDGVGGNRDLNQPDLIHPTPAGHRVIADLVWRTLEPILRKR